MSYNFKKVGGPWAAMTDGERGGYRTVDFHYGRRDPDRNYMDGMAEVSATAFDAIKSAQEDGYPWVLFTHGTSTSGPGKITARSMVRNLMRSPEATPYIDRRRCKQHDVAFLAAIKPKSTAKP